MTADVVRADIRFESVRGLRTGSAVVCTSVGLVGDERARGKGMCAGWAEGWRRAGGRGRRNWGKYVKCRASI